MNSAEAPILAVVERFAVKECGRSDAAGRRLCGMRGSCDAACAARGGGYGGHSIGGVEVIGSHRTRFGLVEQTGFGPSVLPDGSVLQPNMTSNPRPAGQSSGSDNLFATVAADRAFPAAVAELGRSANKATEAARLRKLQKNNRFSVPRFSFSQDNTTSLNSNLCKCAHCNYTSTPNQMTFLNEFGLLQNQSPYVLKLI